MADTQRGKSHRLRRAAGSARVHKNTLADPLLAIRDIYRDLFTISVIDHDAHTSYRQWSSAKVEWLLSRIVGKSPTGIRRGKYAMRAIEAMSFDQAIAYTESQIALLAMTDDANPPRRRPA